MEGGPEVFTGPPLTVVHGKRCERTRWRKQHLHGWEKAGSSSSPTFG